VSLPKDFRLKKRSEFLAVKEKGTLFPSRSFSLLVAEDKQPKRNSLFGFLISRKTDRRAVVRNRIRRRLAAALRPLLRQVKPGYKIIFLVRDRSRYEKISRLTEEIKEVLSRLNILS
jgi:ribonuclease P protein component